MRILWIEDSENISVENYFESKVFNDHEIDPIIEHSKDGFLFDRAYRFIDEQLERYDYIIIDIDLKNSDIKKDGKAEEIMNLLESNSKEEFLEAAGFDLYIQLMERGFPKERIIFFSANAGSALADQAGIIKELISAIREENQSNFKIAYKELKITLGDKGKKEIEDAYNSQKLLDFCKELLAKIKEDISKEDSTHTFQTLEEHFYLAHIDIPNKAISKNNHKRLERWFDTRLNFDDSKNEEENENHIKNYLTLRRGILNVIEFLEEKETKLTKRFEDQIDKVAFFEGLRWLLQPHKLDYKQAGKFYLTLCDYMSKPFESLKYPELMKEPRFDKNKFPDSQTMIKSWIENRSNMIPAKFLRNWIAHGLITGSNKTPNFTAADVAFTFLIVIKSLFDRDMSEHKWGLKRLFGDQNIPFKAIRTQVLKLHNRVYRTPYIKDKLDVINDLGQKPKNSSYPEKTPFWKNQNYLFHFYASCLLASSNLIRSTSEDKNQTIEEKYTVNMTYELQKTSFIKIAYKRLQELSE